MKPKPLFPRIVECANCGDDVEFMTALIGGGEKVLYFCDMECRDVYHIMEEDHWNYIIIGDRAFTSMEFISELRKLLEIKKPVR